MSYRPFTRQVQSVRLVIVAVLLVITTACQSTSSPTAAAYGPKFAEHDQGFTAVVVAYAPEMEGILGRIEADPNASITQMVTYKGIKYRIGKYHDEPILIFATGMSIANAAMSMQMAFDYFPVKQVVYMGIAGAVNPEWQPGTRPQPQP